MTEILSTTAFRRFGLVAAVVGLTVGCATLPERPDEPEALSLPAATAGPLTELSTRFSDRHGAQASGFRLLDRADESFLARLALVDSAIESIDIQYFIWQDDATGALLFDRVLRAADRGVRVRLLVDDLAVAAKSRDLAAFSSHPHLEIRLYNPNASRDNAVGWAFRYMASFKELNRRMHNKVLVVDGRAAIAGGRNIGNDYFGLSSKYNFHDIDVLATGAVIGEIAHAFDDYWNDETAFPTGAWSDDVEPGAADELRAEQASAIEEAASGVLVAYPVEPIDWTDWLHELETSLVPGTAHFLQDDPVEIDGRDYRLIDLIDLVARPATQELLITSPYLIPVGPFLEDITATVDRGVGVTLLTGSLGSNNHTAAHSHYKKYRRQILATGADLFEFRHDPSDEVAGTANVPPVTPKFISLHAKTIVVDRAQCYIGSLNFDPRALVLNTENGFYIESPALCGELAAKIDGLTRPDNAWQVGLDERDRLVWTSALGTVTKQPARSGGQRVSDFFLRLLPIEKQL